MKSTISKQLEPLQAARRERLYNENGEANIEMLYSDEYAKEAMKIIEAASEIDFLEFLKERLRHASTKYKTSILMGYFGGKINRAQTIKKAGEYISRLLSHLEQIATRKQFHAVLYSKRAYLEEELAEQGVILAYQHKKPGEDKPKEPKPLSLKELLSIYTDIVKDAPSYEEALNFSEGGRQALLKAQKKVEEEVKYLRDINTQIA